MFVYSGTTLLVTGLILINQGEGSTKEFLDFNLLKINWKVSTSHTVWRRDYPPQKSLILLSMYMYSTEPLYQVYTRRTLQRERNLSRRRLSSDVSLNDAASLEELTKGTLRNMRMLWCELPEVCTLYHYLFFIAQ